MAGTKQEVSVVVAGGGYAGTIVAQELDPIATVTLVDPKAAFFHNVAALRALADPRWLDRVFFSYERLLARGRFVRDSVVAADGTSVTLASGERLTPDYLVLATGSAYPFPAKVHEPDPERARAALLAAHRVLRRAGQVLIVGAGPTGLELAGEVRHFFPEVSVTVVDAAADVLAGPFDRALRDELRRQLGDLGVRLVLGSPLRRLPSAPPASAADIAVETESGEKLSADVWYRCFGVVPESGYLRHPLALARTPAGRVSVDPFLRVRGPANVFALGDLADVDRPTAGAAHRQADLVVANIRASIAGLPLTAYRPSPPGIAVPLGPRGGAGQFPGQAGIAGPELVAEVKGRALRVEQTAARFGIEMEGLPESA